MTWKVLALIQFILTLLLGAALLSQYVSVKSVSPVVREPAAPGESTLAYTPPAGRGGPLFVRAGSIVPTWMELPIVPTISPSFSTARSIGYDQATAFKRI